MKLIQYVNAQIALGMLARKELPYSVSLKLVTLKRSIAPKVEFYIAEEKKLADRFARVGDNGKPAYTGGKFECAGDTPEEIHANTAEFERLRGELGMTEDDETPEKINVRVTEEFQITPEALEALEPFVSFEVAE